MDLFNPFIIELSIAVPSSKVPPGRGNEVPEDLIQFPVVIVTPPPSIQVYFILNKMQLLIFIKLLLTIIEQIASYNS